MLAGGAEATVIPAAIGGFIACKALSKRNDDPAGGAWGAGWGRAIDARPSLHLAAGIWHLASDSPVTRVRMCCLAPCPFGLGRLLTRLLLAPWCSCQPAVGPGPRRIRDGGGRRWVQ